MNHAKRILIVEDQKIVAADLERTLEGLGYVVAGTASSGEEAVQKTSHLHPDLVVMDIRLQGEMDGIRAAEIVRERFDLPVVYLTAYADEQTILRARITAPFGYIVKPFNERELRGTIEIALYKHQSDREREEARLRLAKEEARRRTAEEEQRRFRLLIEGVSDYAILMLDPEGRVASWNTGAERIKGYRAEEIIGKRFSIFYPQEDAARGKPEQELSRALSEGRVEDEGWRVRKDGSRFWGNVVITALRDDAGRLEGFAKVTRDLSYRKSMEDAQRFLDQATMILASSLDVSDTLQRVCRLAVPDLGDSCIIHLASETGQLEQACGAHVNPNQEELAKQLARLLSPGPGLERGPRHVFWTGKPEIYPELADRVWPAAVPGAEHPSPLRELGVLSYVFVPIQFRGRTLGVLSLVRAMPPRRYSEQDLALAEEFARRAGMAIDNARLYREAQEAIRARDEFLAIASHELKTPLTPLQLQIDVLCRALESAGGKTEQLDK